MRGLTEIGRGRFRNQPRQGPTDYLETIRLEYAEFLPIIPAPCRESMQNAWAKATRKQHESGLRAYITWADEVGLDKGDRFPAKASTLEEFAASWLKRGGSASVRSKVYGVRAFHVLNRLNWVSSMQLDYILEGVKRAAPKDKKREAREPMTVERLTLLAENLDLTEPKDIAVMGIAPALMFGQMWAGEVLPSLDRIEDFDPRKHPTRKDLGQPFSTKGSRALDLPFTKTAKEKGERVAICAQPEMGDACPSAAMDYHIAANELQDDSPIASYLELSGARKVLTARAFVARCNEIWKDAGLSRLTGHCFRIGGTTFYLLEGVSPDVVKAMGRWSSDAFLKYWRKLEALGLVHIEGLAGGEKGTI